MNARLLSLFEQVQMWSAEDQARFVDYAHGIETRRKERDALHERAGNAEDAPRGGDASEE